MPTRSESQMIKRLKKLMDHKILKCKIEMAKRLKRVMDHKRLKSKSQWSKY